jgi:SAM-dependent methyltransferase
VAALPYPDAGFELVLSIEAMSHYRQPARFLAEAARVLRPGGALIIADGNNARHAPTRQKTRQIWAAFENGPATDDIYGHRVEKPFVQMRREMIAGAFPQLSPAELDALAAQTSGLWGEQVLAAAGAYVQTGRLPGRRWDGATCPLDPLNGYYIENLLDPLELTRELRRLGFRAAARAYFGGARGGLVQRANATLTQPAFSPLALRFTPSFRILARKLEPPA